mgnify:CR=1 FL=1|jgi:hypothetical protein|tara:strand:+ start:479 stop:862 length:384 start_codon:yes stop_codon:yes gene_type:complete
MSIISKIISGDVLKNVNNIVDELHSSPIEKKEIKLKFKQLLADAESKAQEQVTRRWESDNKAGWLPANIRPLTLAFLIISTVLLVFIDSGTINFNVAERWISLIEICNITCIGAYFGSRGLEKIKKK